MPEQDINQFADHTVQGDEYVLAQRPSGAGGAGGKVALDHDNLANKGSNAHSVIDAHLASTTNPHGTSLANIATGTLATLNGRITDATLIDTGDSRLSDARTPTSHASSHQSGGGDAIKLDDLAAADDNTDLNATSSAHGLMPKLSNNATDFANGTGGYSKHGAFTEQAYFTTEVDNGNSGTSKTIDWTNGNKQKIGLTDNCTFTFTPPTGPSNLVLKMTQDVTGSRTVTWPAAVKWPGGTAPTLTTTGSAVDIVTLYFDGTNYYGSTGLNFS